MLNKDLLGFYNSKEFVALKSELYEMLDAINIV